MEPTMKLAALVSSALFIASSLAIPTSATAQQSNARARPPIPELAGRNLTPPRPAGLGGNLTPGHGGPNPRDSRSDGAGSTARNGLGGLVTVCGPGGVLSAAGAANNPGRTRARALVCND